MTAKPDQPWRRFAVARPTPGPRVRVDGANATLQLDPSLAPSPIYDAPLPNRRERRAQKRPR